MKKIVITSGYYNPLHIGHIDLIREAKKLGDFLVVVVNNDEQVKIKRSVPFMPEKERVEIIRALKYVDDVFLSIDRDTGRQDKTLTFLAEKYEGSDIIFAKGGDSTMQNVEKDTCEELGIKIVLGVGGGKVQSSSWLLNKIAKK
ncbi:MAG: adenylyltransferase/cytidyltransferase family protein [Candidatus Staskawiczbacteria bacterium]|nr:adenylyltransferase/cytidyltransferase family protein [Candidatus Staskawiczbacteria bacterium]